MRVRILFCFALVLGGILSGCSSASHHAAGKLDLAAYRIEQVPIKNDVPFDGPDWRVCQNILVFSNSNIRIPLARSAVAQAESNLGFDPASLKLHWLKQDELLLISWTTFYQGSGGYTHDGNVILQIHGGQGRALFRDYIESVAKGGWAAQYFSLLAIAYNDSDQTIQFSRRSTAINGNMGAPEIGHPYPFTTAFTNDEGQAGYISKVDTVDTWRYQLAGNSLKFLEGTSAVNLGDDAQPIDEIATSFHVNRTALESMNPGFRGRQKATGIVVLDTNLKPYEVSFDDGLHGDK